MKGKMMSLRSEADIVGNSKLSQVDQCVSCSAQSRVNATVEHDGNVLETHVLIEAQIDDLLLVVGQHLNNLLQATEVLSLDNLVSF